VKLLKKKEIIWSNEMDFRDVGADNGLNETLFISRRGKEGVPYTRIQTVHMPTGFCIDLPRFLTTSAGILTYKKTTTPTHS
jgi:hypothetical protein